MSDASLVAWREQMNRLLRDGEIPDTPMATPEIRPGCDVRSASIRYDDGEGDFQGTPVGGVVIGRGPEGWVTVDSHRGRIRYHHIVDSDVDFTLYQGLIRKDVLRGLAKQIKRAMARDPKAKHLAALVRITALAEQ
jgi:hypothetical protein